MAAENDPSDWLPTPPPPRPARRDAAIEAALRRFDGVEEAPATKEAARRGWVSTHRAQLGVAVSAVLLVIVGVPAALIGLRNAPTVSEPAAPPPEVRYSEPKAPRARSAEPAPAQSLAVTPLPQSVAAPALRKNRGDEAGGSTRSQPPAEAKSVAAAETAAPAPVAAAPPPPPPPAVASADEAATQDMVVTGSLAGQRAPERAAAPSARGFALQRPAKAAAQAPAYAAFLSRLQSAVRSNDRRGVIGLAGFPLRVNRDGRPHFYRDASALERDFDRVFTPKVRRAILAQRPERLFVRDLGAMVGDGEVWFDQSCAPASCSAAAPVRIIAINP